MIQEKDKLGKMLDLYLPLVELPLCDLNFSKIYFRKKPKMNINGERLHDGELDFLLY
jgi:hypothetical protein